VDYFEDVTEISIPGVKNEENQETIFVIGCGPAI
jgi:hypothetical protein